MDPVLFIFGLFYLVGGLALTALHVQFGRPTGWLAPVVYAIILLALDLGGWLIYLSFTPEGASS